MECLAANLLDGGRQRDAGQTAAVAEKIAFHFDDETVDGCLDELAAVLEGRAANGLDRVGNNHLAQ